MISSTAQDTAPHPDIGFPHDLLHNDLTIMVSLNNKLFNDAEYLKCHIESHREIIRLLSMLSAKRQMIRILLDNEVVIGMTLILDVDQDSDEMTIDCLSQPEQNQRILAAKHVFFDTALDQVPIIFDADSVVDSDFDARPALALAVPENMIRLQRRELFRINTSGKNSVFCVIPLPPKLGGRNCVLPLIDLSAGGVCIFDEKHLLDDTVGRVYPNCRIDLHEMGTITTALQVRNSRDVVLTTGKIVRRLGCQFYEMPQMMVDRIERFIIKVERNQIDDLRWNGEPERYPRR